MFLRIIDNVYIINQSAIISTDESRHISWFDNISHENHWDDYRAYFPDMGYVLKVTSALADKIEPIVVIPDEDFHKFLYEYVKYLRLDDEAVECLYVYNNACSLYSDGFRKYSDTKGVMDRKPFVIRKEDFSNAPIDIDFERFPAELSVNCLDQDWARRKFERMRSAAIYRTVKEIQFLAIRNGSMGPEEFKDISGDREREIDKLLLAKVRIPVLDALDRVGFDTESYRLPIELYVDEMPDYGIDASEPFRFNYLLAKHIKETGYRIDKRNE